MKTAGYSIDTRKKVGLGIGNVMNKNSAFQVNDFRDFLCGIKSKYGIQGNKWDSKVITDESN